MCSPHDGRPTRRPLPQSVLPPAHPSAPGAGDQIKQADRGEPGRGGWARDERGEAIGSVPSSSFISSSSHPLIPVPSSVIAACAVFAARCSLFLFSSSRRLPSWLVSSSHPSSHPRRCLICRLAVSCAVSLARRSSFRPSSRSSFRRRSAHRPVVVSFYPVGSFPLLVSSTREGGAFFSFDSEAGRASKQRAWRGAG